MSKEPELKYIPLKDIRESQSKLRNVDRQSDVYLQLVESIKDRGVLNSASVREGQEKDENGKERIVYFLTDGLHRFYASKDAGKETIPCQVMSMDDGEVLEAQLIANVHKIETRPVEYSRQLLRILAGNVLLTATELAGKLNKSPSWIGERLGLLKLEKNIAELVDTDKLNLSNAYALAKLPPEEQGNFLERAMTQSPQEFVPAANSRVKEIRDAKRQGKSASPETFSPIPRLQKIADMQSELETSIIALTLCKKVQPKTPEAAFSLGVKWSLHLDPNSVTEQEIKWNERQKAAKEAKEKRADERKAKELAKAREKINELEGKKEETAA